MAKHHPPRRNGLKSVSSPPEHVIDEEVGAQEEDDGTVTVDEKTVRAEGAANAEAARENRRRSEIIARKRGGERRVPWNEINACLLYDDVVQLWPPNTLTICVTRLTGTPATQYLYGSPRSGVELYAAIKQQVHGRREETEYSVAMRDAQTKFDRGKGRITLPSTLDEAGSAPAVHAPAPVAVPAPAPSYGYAPPSPAVTDPVVAQLMREVGELRAALGQRAPMMAAPPPPVAPAMPQPVPMPTAMPPGGVMFIPGLGYVQSIAAPVAAAASAPTPAVAPAPPQPVTVREAMSEALGLVKDSVGVVTSMQSMLPQPVATAAAAVAAPADEGPTQVLDLGDMKIVQNTRDGSLRPVETFLANAKTIKGWVSEQQDKYQAHQKEVARIQGGQAPTTQQQQPTSAGQMPGPTMPR